MKKKSKKTSTKTKKESINFKPAKIIGVLFLLGAVFAGVSMVQRNQNIEEQASVPDGIAKVYLEPVSGNYRVGDTVFLQESFDTAYPDVTISGIATRLIYPYSGSVPEIVVDAIEINPDFTASGDWVCPTQSSSLQNGNVVIDIACANTSASGYSPESRTRLATIKLSIKSLPAINPVTFRFDPVLSVVTQKPTNLDILLTPTATTVLTIGETGLTPTPTRRPTPTITTSVTPTLAAGQCYVLLYPSAVTIRSGEELPFAAYVNGGKIDRVKFTSEDLKALAVRPTFDSKLPYLATARGHKVSEVTQMRVMVQVYEKGVEKCRGYSTVRIVPS